MVYGGENSGGSSTDSSGDVYTDQSVPPMADYQAEASDVLEMALRQMNSILAETDMDLAVLDDSMSTNCSESESLPSSKTQPPPSSLSNLSKSSADPVLQAVERLKLAISVSQKMNGGCVPVSVSDETRCMLLTWLRGEAADFNEKTSGRSSLEYDERLQRLEADKSALQSQVSVLTELIDSQTEKISELQHQVHTRQMLLGKAEDRLQKDLALQQELLQRSSFETQKLELMNKLSSLTLQQRTLEKENMELRSRLRQAETFISSRQLTSPGRAKRDKPPLAPRSIQHHQHQQQIAASIQQQKQQQHSSSPCDTTPSSNAVTPCGENGINGAESDDSEVCPPHSNNYVTPVTSRHGQHTSLPNSPPAVCDSRRIVSLGGTLPRGRTQTDTPDVTGRTGTGTGTLGSGTEEVITGNTENTPTSAAGKQPTESTPFSPFTKQKSLRRLFGKIKRSGSGGLDGNGNGTAVSNDGEFKRGGIRSTAAPRINYSPEKVNACTSPLYNDRSLRLSDWSTAMLVSWFNEMGLSAYTEQLRYWGVTGCQLVSSSAAELVKQLNMKHPMHMKKLLLAVRAASFESAPDLPGHLDHNFVLRWLDDVGLPLYREAFLEARVDGRVLDQLSLHDLQILRVNNLVHALSLKRGIQVLRQGGFSVGCLRRRSTAEEQRPPPPSEVALWTNHRAMEWLREIDLAEYAPNMRGSGVHGALFIYEPRFSGELLASVLAIPASKSLLRRHLYTKFNELIGPDILKQKRSVEEDPTVTPLRIDAKIKFHKRGQLTLRRRKSRPSDDSEELLCPQELTLQNTSLHENSFHDATVQEGNSGQENVGDIANVETNNADSNCNQETIESNHTVV